MKVLVFTTDVIPLAGLPTSGTALRTWGLINGLRAHGHKVIVSAPQTALNGLLKHVDIQSLPEQSRKELDVLQRLSFHSTNQSAVLAETNPDVVLCGHWPAMALRVKPSQAVIIDLAGPHLLERHYQGMPGHREAVLGKLTAIGTADYYIVSGPSQRLYFLSFLLRTEVPNAEKRIVTIPMPLDPDLPIRALGRTAAADYPSFIFGGVFLPWQDPSRALGYVSDKLTEKNRGALTLIGGKHPHYKIKEGLYGRLFASLNQNPRVISKPMLPYAQFLEELREADVAVDLMKWNLERQLAMTIRSTTYLWAGLPVIYNDYADLGQLIRRYDAGWCVSPEDEPGLSAVLESVFNDSALVERKSKNASRLAQEVFSWDRAVEPLLRLVVSPERELMRETDIIYDFPDNAELPVLRQIRVEQYFLCRMNGLAKVECRLATHNRPIRAPLRLGLYQLDKGGSTAALKQQADSAKLVAERLAEPSAIQNNEWFALDLKPVRDSGGKAFLLTVESEEEDIAASVSPWAVKGSPFPLLGLYHGSRYLKHASLCFRTTCSNVTI